MTDDYDDLLAELDRVTRERNQALADLADARQALTGVRQALTADRDRWRKIALWNLEMAGYDNPEEHVRLCYYEDGTYHGGAR